MIVDDKPKEKQELKFYQIVESSLVYQYKAVL